MPAGDKNDPFSGSRKWLKAWTRDLADPVRVTLPYAARGLMQELEKFSLTASDTPGFFLYAGSPMKIDTILRGTQPADVDELAVAAAGMQILAGHGFIVYDDIEGWSIPGWPDRQDKSIVEPDAARKLRIGAATRKRNQRAREAGESKITNIDRRREAGEG